MENLAINPTVWQPISFTSFMSGKSENSNEKDPFLGKEVTDMTLNTLKIVALDGNDEECLISDFKPQLLNLQGLRASFFINSKSGLQLKDGNYKSFRFYLDSKDNSFKTSHRKTEYI